MSRLLKAIWALAVMAVIASLVALGHSPGTSGPTSSTASTPEYLTRHDRTHPSIEYGVRESGRTTIETIRLAY